MVSIEKDGKIIIEEVEPEEKPKVNQLSQVELGSYVHLIMVMEIKIMILQNIYNFGEYCQKRIKMWKLYQIKLLEILLYQVK